MAKHRRHHLLRRRRQQPGTEPGTLSIDPQAPRPQMELIGYSPVEVLRRPIQSVREVAAERGRWPVLWLNVEGLGDAGVLLELAALFQLHPLAMEDVVNQHQRAKVEQYSDATFIVFHMMAYGPPLDTEQISLFLGPGFVVTFQDKLGGDCLNPVRDRIIKGHARIRENGADYLAYCVLDAVVDHYFPVLESYGERLETLEDRIVERPTQTFIAEVHSVKRELLTLRRLIWPLREALNALLRETNPHLREETKLYLRDCYDHAVRVIDLIETDREICSDLMDLYMSSASNRMSEIMKVLTIMSTVFIPLTFVAGVYGMNFHTDSPLNMPELTWYWGYPACLAAMGLIALVQLYFFWRRGWLGAGPAAAASEEAASRQEPPAN